MPQSARARSRHRFPAVGLAAALLVVCLAGRGVAQTCTGDCSGIGRVTIRDLILAVNIALGRADAAQCPALGGGSVGIAQLIASVSNALCECAPCPTRPPTATYTATAPPTPTATFTASPLPTAAPLTSVWREDNIKIPNSSCSAALTNDLRRQLADVAVSYTARMNGDMVELEDELGEVAVGAVDPDGTIHVEYFITQSEGTCSVTLDLPLSVKLTRSPATATYAARVTSRGCPVTLNCTLRITSRWTRISAAVRRGASLGVAARPALRLTP